MTLEEWAARPALSEFRASQERLQAEHDAVLGQLRWAPGPVFTVTGIYPTGRIAPPRLNKRTLKR